MSNGRYYLSRVIKIAELNQEKLINAICNAPIVEVGKFDWTITDVVDKRHEKVPYIFGKLSKYAKVGRIKKVDESTRTQIDASTENLLEASSPFIYLPEFSGIAFLHVWNSIQEEIFIRRFKVIIESAYDSFFVGCEVEPVIDYRAFASKLKSINRFTEISAKVYPPNPLFGRLWGSLNQYIKERNAADISIKETSSNKNGVKTEILDLVTNIMKNPNYEPPKMPDITDAALLMAADGYGRGKVTGYEQETLVVIKTSESQKSFLFNKDPDPELLMIEAQKQFTLISKERDMKH